jgi:transcriptional regulator with XRE-family HTH domain
MARAAVGIGIRELAEKAALSPATISRYESGRGGAYATSLDKIKAVFEEMGLVFIANGQVAIDGEGPGVRFRDRR